MRERPSRGEKTGTYQTPKRALPICSVYAKPTGVILPLWSVLRGLEARRLLVEGDYMRIASSWPASIRRLVAIGRKPLTTTLIDRLPVRE